MESFDTIFRIGAWTVDPTALVLSDGDRAVRLRPKVMELLVALADRPGKVFSKQDLLDVVWRDVTVSDASLIVAVGELREALGDRADTPEYIETIPRRGYRLIAEASRSGSGPHATLDGSSRFWLFGHEARFALVEGRNVIGRAPDAQVRIPSTKVSRYHAQIIVEGNQAVVEDLQSKNGTFVGDDKIEQPTPLAHGDELRLGKMVATLRVVTVGRDSTVTELSEETPTDRPVKG